MAEDVPQGTSIQGIDTDQARIDAILERGTIVEVLPTKAAFREKLQSGERLRFYIGFDATAPTLHLSHAKNLMLLEKFRKLGHEAIILFGDFTARIGDPSGESATRRQLTREEVMQNVEQWKRLIRPLMDFDDNHNPPQIRYNHDWLSKIGLEDLLQLGTNFTVQQMLERDMFEKRIADNKPIYLHEFMYPLMQGYDSVAMDVDVELCGTDQTFNALTGRVLQRRLHDKEKFVVAVTLMANPKTGELMSKSKGTGVFLDAAPADMYGQVMAQPDEMMEILFTHNTSLALEEIKEIVNHDDKRDAKMRLAREIVSLFYGEKQAAEAEQAFVQVFQNKQIPEEVEEVHATQGDLLSEVLVRAQTVPSKSEFRRLVDAGAVANMDTSGEKVTEHDAVVSQSALYKVGKRRFIRVVV